jgi:formyltetrahydrofolate hydrolase
VNWKQKLSEEKKNLISLEHKHIEFQNASSVGLLLYFEKNGGCPVELLSSKRNEQISVFLNTVTSHHIKHAKFMRASTNPYFITGGKSILEKKEKQMEEEMNAAKKLVDTLFLKIKDEPKYKCIIYETNELDGLIAQVKNNIKKA